MKEIDVSVRKLSVYQTDDGKRIEEWTKEKKIKTEVEDSAEGLDGETPEKVYVGVMHLMSRMGPKEVKFEIKANNLEEAFGKYKTLAEETLSGIQAKIKEMEEKQKQQNAGGGIVQVPASALDNLRRPGGMRV